jgi:acetyl-CoA acetyltransferase
MKANRQAAVVGVGSTSYVKRGQSSPATTQELGAKAILAALDDAGLAVDDLDGFVYFATGLDTGWFAEALGVPTIRFSASAGTGGNASASSVALAATVVEAGVAEVVVSVMATQQLPARRFGSAFAYRPPTPEGDFENLFGLLAPGHAFALIAQRYMHEFGITREHLYQVVRTHRDYGLTRPKSLLDISITHEEYFSARMIADPLCLYDFTLESDGAVAVITTTADRAKDLPNPPVYVLGSATAGDGRWGRGINWLGMDDDLFTTAGARLSANELYAKSGLSPSDINVALLYDHFSPAVFLQLEDYGFCGRGEAGDFVADGNTTIEGRLPVNTHGGHLGEAYVVGMTHVAEGIEQIRGTAINQVSGAEVALVTGGPSILPVGAILFGSSAP